MDDLQKLRAVLPAIEKALAVQQTLVRTLGVLFLTQASSGPDDVRRLADVWHALIDDDRTTSRTPESLKEEEREMARQYVDALAAIVSARRALE